jgi:hypothetical protein
MLSAGGIEAAPAEAFSSCEDVVSAFRASGAALACLCSSEQAL